MTIFVGRELAVSIGGILHIGVGSFVNAFFEGLTSWITSGATALLGALGHAITSSTEPTFTNGFSIELSVVTHIGAELTVPFLAIAVISAVVQQDLSVLVRAVFIRLPLSFVLAGGAVELVSLALVATNSMCSAMLAAANPSIGTVLHSLSAALAGLGGTNAPLGAFGAAFFAGMAVLVAFLLWLELVLRSAAISVAVLFLPIALAGMVWSATSHWARRLAETIAAMVLSKLVIAGVLALAATSIAHSDGSSEAIEGIAMLALAVLSPFSLLRIVPAVEAGAISHFEGLSHRALRGARMGGSTAADLISGFGGDGFVDDSDDSLPFLQGDTVEPKVIDHLARQIRLDMDRYAAGNGGVDESDPDEGEVSVGMGAPGATPKRALDE